MAPGHWVEIGSYGDIGSQSKPYGVQERRDGKIYTWEPPGRWVETGSFGPIGSQGTTTYSPVSGGGGGVSKTDINPATGKMYAINPATGVWDDNYWSNVVEPQLRGQAGGGGGGYPQWAFDFERAEEESFKRLAPYYEDLLRLTGGDVSLAKKKLEFDYKSGLRIAKSEFEEQSRSQALQFPQEKEQLVTGLGRRGVIGASTEKELWGKTAGGLAGKTASRLVESQSVREEAISRALKDREEQLTKGRSFGLEEVERSYERERKSLGREHEKESIAAALNKMGIEQVKYASTAGEWQAEEARRARQEEQEKWDKWFAEANKGEGVTYA